MAQLYPFTSSHLTSTHLTYADVNMTQMGYQSICQVSIPCTTYVSVCQEILIGLATTERTQYINPLRHGVTRPIMLLLTIVCGSLICLGTEGLVSAERSKRLVLDGEYDIQSLAMEVD